MSNFISGIIFIFLYILVVWFLLGLVSDIFLIRKFSIIEVTIFLFVYNTINFKIFNIIDVFFNKNADN